MKTNPVFLAVGMLLLAILGAAALFDSSFVLQTALAVAFVLLGVALKGGIRQRCRRFEEDCSQGETKPPFYHAA